MAKICPAKILLKNDDWHATPQASKTLACFKFASIKKLAKAKKTIKIMILVCSPQSVILRL
jgi:hypothetical protein